MELSPKALQLVSVIPLLGLGIMAAVLFALGAKKDRWIITGSLLMVLLLAGAGLALEYGGKLKSKLSPESEVMMAENLAEPAAPSEPDSRVVIEPALEPGGSDAPIEEPASEPRSSARESQPSRLVPIDRNSIKDPKKPSWEPGRGGIVRTDSPITSSRRETSDEPRTTRRTQPEPTPPAPTPVRTPPAPTPVPEPIPAHPVETPAPTVARTEPARTTPPPTYTPPPTPTRRVEPETTTGGKGALVVRIKGPIVETSKEPARGAHVMVIVDGKMVKTAPPTRSSESHQDNNPSAPLLAVTYFWEDLVFTFDNISPGQHIVQVDASLESSSSHRGQMTSTAGQTQNDYNGSVEVKAGQTVTVEFGSKNWNTGQLTRVR